MRIPRLIHQSWRDDGFPKTLFNWRWQQGLLDLNPGWRLVRWTDNSSRALIATQYAWFLPTYDAYPSYIQRSDAARYFIIYHHGGVYADLDIECSKPFAPVLAAHRALFSYKQGTNMSRGLVNALFASEARHPLWRTVFTLLTNRSALGTAAATHVDVVRSTGPGLLREALLHLRDANLRTRDGKSTPQPMGADGGGAAAAGAAGGDDALSRQGIALLDASVWHPIVA
jgi:mannosyltransferase OCH1-like enzyme